METRYDLKALMRAADKACDALFPRRGELKAGCVNWGDFACVGAEYWIDQDGNEGYRVMLEEADPSNYEVQNFVYEKLAAEGFVDVEVRTEW